MSGSPPKRQRRRPAPPDHRAALLRDHDDAPYRAITPGEGDDAVEPWGRSDEWMRLTPDEAEAEREDAAALRRA